MVLCKIFLTQGEANYFFHTNTIDKYAVDNQNGWEMGTFKLGSKEFRDTWGYAYPEDNLPINHKGYNENIMRLCGEDLKNGANNERTFTIPMHKYDKYGTANYFQSTRDFSEWKGWILFPSRRIIMLRKALSFKVV